jgi:hypothetical protein
LREVYRWLLPVVFGALISLVFKLLVWCGAEGYVSSLRASARKPDITLLMMGIVVLETC